MTSAPNKVMTATFGHFATIGDPPNLPISPAISIRCCHILPSKSPFQATPDLRKTRLCANFFEGLELSETNCVGLL